MSYPCGRQRPKNLSGVGLYRWHTQRGKSHSPKSENHPDYHWFQETTSAGRSNASYVCSGQARIFLHRCQDRDLIDENLVDQAPRFFAADLGHWATRSLETGWKYFAHRVQRLEIYHRAEPSPMTAQDRVRAKCHDLAKLDQGLSEADPRSCWRRHRRGHTGPAQSGNCLARRARPRAPLGLEKLRGNLTIKSDFAMERLNFSGFSQHVSDKSWLGPLQVK